jgi:hypothetical protein
MKHITRWGPLAIAMLTLLAIHSWFLVFMLRGAAPLQSSSSFQPALLASLRDLPGTASALLPVWLPALIPSKWHRLQKWATLICGAIALAVALSFVFVVALHQDQMAFAVSVVYGAAGALHLLHRCSATTV